APYVQTTPSGGADPFNITVTTFGDADCYASEIAAAAARWESILTSGFASTTIDFVDGACEVNAPTRRYAIDDLEIAINIMPIDGAGGTLGMAGPCYLVGGTRPVFGMMQLDIADIAGLRSSGRLVDTLTHEMGHILGIGTMWGGAGLLAGGDADPVFTGTHAVASWNELGGTGPVPVEDTGGSGTRLAHWRESVFDQELMTGWLEYGRANPISAVTIASLKDLGYSVDASKKDPYSLPAGLRWGALVSGFGAGEPLHTEPITPIAIG
ncbi:MAG: hypothetical protein GX868_06235, partial [Actinobacteria bacterium]|nr:hypothetical protein [Actinomycetota bacterium]